MALISCHECGAEMSDQAAACPRCNAPRQKSKAWLWLAGGLAGIAVLFVLSAGNSPQANEKAKARRAIDLCWEDQRRKSLSAGTQQFIAGACEQMESRFVQKYGHRP